MQSLCVLRLPSYLSSQAGKTLDLMQVNSIVEYDANVSDCMRNVRFDTNNFTNVAFYPHRDGRYSVWALPNDLSGGVEFLLNKDKEKPKTALLRNEVLDYLNKNTALGISIEQFI